MDTHTHTEFSSHLFACIWRHATYDIFFGTSFNEGVNKYLSKYGSRTLELEVEYLCATKLRNSSALSGPDAVGVGAVHAFILLARGAMGVCTYEQHAMSTE